MLQAESQGGVYEKRGQEWHLPFNILTLNHEGILVFDAPPPPSRYRFSCFGIIMHLSLTPVGDDTTCSIWAEVGNLPYTAESGKGRAEGIEILRAARHLTNTRFYAEKGQRIYVLYESKITGHHTLDSLMVEILYYVQQALPFINLLRERGCGHR